MNSQVINTRKILKPFQAFIPSITGTKKPESRFLP